MLKLLKRILKALFITAFMVVVSGLLAASYILDFANKTDLHEADAAIVLGAAAWGDNPSPVLAARAEHAVGLYERGLVKKIVFTGGTPNLDFPTEAEVAAKWAIKRGIPESDVLLEKNSRKTWGNFAHAKPLLQQNGISSLIIVSDPYHLARSYRIARKQGLDVQTSAAQNSRFNTASISTKMKFLIRESYWLLIVFMLG